MTEEAPKPQLGTWLNISQIVRPNFVDKTLAAHFALCHIRPTHRLGISSDGQALWFSEKTVFVIVNGKDDRYRLGTRNGKSVNFTASDVLKFPTRFSVVSIPYSALFFNSPWQVMFSKADLLSLPQRTA